MTDTRNRRSHLRFCIYNANGVANKQVELNEFLEKYKIDVLFLTETHLRPTKTFKLKNMVGHRTDRLHRRGGGTAIFLRQSITHHVEQLPPLQSIEATAVTIATHMGHITLVSAYSAPRGELHDQDLFAIFDTYNTVLLCGDLNAKHHLWHSRQTNARGTRIHELEERLLAVTMGPRDPTYIPFNANHHPDVLDIAMVKNLDVDLQLRTVNDLTSDHQPVLGQLTRALTEPPPRTQKTVDWQQYRRWLNNNVRPTIDVSTTDRIDAAIATLTSKIHTAAKKASTTTVLPSPTYSQFPPLLQDLKYLKNRARKRYQRRRHPAYRRDMHQLQRELRKRAQEWRSEEWGDTMAAITLKQRRDWKLVRSLRRPKEQKVAMDNDGTLIYDALQKAELFAATYETQNMLNDDDHPDQEFDDEIRLQADRIRATPNHDLPDLSTPQEVRHIIRRLASASAPGPDKVTNDHIKQLPRKPLVLLTRIFNSCLINAYFPTAWKTAKIVPIPKPGKDLKRPENHRPISLLSTLSKVFERILLPRIRLPLTENDFLRIEQFAFQERLSAELQLLRITEFISDKMNRRQYTAGIFLDVEKAFDKVWKDMLLVKLHASTDIPTGYLHLIDQFLTDRRFFIEIEGHRSDIKTLQTGLPQGSVLSPTLFATYVNDMPLHQDVLLAQFADDTAFLTSSRRLDTTINRLQRQLDTMETWLRRNKIKVNAGKTKAVLFTRRKPELHRQLQLNGQNIAWAPETKYLGVILDSKLIFKRHILDKREKAIKTIYSLYPIFKSTDIQPHYKLRLYQAILLPMLLYGCSSWGTACKTNLLILQRIQNRCLRLILNAPRYSRTTDLHNAVQIPTIAQQIRTRTDKLIRKVNALRPHSRHLTNVATVEPAPWHKVKVPLSIVR